ncbi:MAG: NdvB protein [Pseudomonadota bacterium]
MTKDKLASASNDGERFNLYCAKALPQATAFLWNRVMLVQLNCRGYAVAQHMQPEPGKYSHGPMLEQRTFMQPEQAYYEHHPGRFVYIKDEADSSLFSAPHDPVRATADAFEFSAGKSDVRWRVSNNAIDVELCAQLPVDEAAELWRITVTNTGSNRRSLSVYPSFTIGYMSWMNQSAQYDERIGGIVACSITPYQKLEDYEKIRSLKDCTFLLHDTDPDAWETSRMAFEGEGGLRYPDGVRAETLDNGDAIYESPIASLQYRITLAPGESREFRFLFGPARNHDDIMKLRERYLQPGGFEQELDAHRRYLQNGHASLNVTTPDGELDHFINHWLSRQVLYHGQLNRLTTDPQTRNYLQDAMGMAYIAPRYTRDAIVTALSQQDDNGGMPEGVILKNGASLKYINQIPHTDHCVWLPICLHAYLNETGDTALLAERVTGHTDGAPLTVFDRITNAMQWLVNNRDERGLSLIAQGDWCDPMNMVGHHGKGVSGWLSLATIYALKLWNEIAGSIGELDVATRLQSAIDESTAAVQKYLWDGEWFARGITDDGRSFGVSDDSEGSLFLNPQTWAIMAGVASTEQCRRMIDAIDERLATPYGMMLLAPSFTHMHEDIGRITQKFPGTAENGSVYNHAAMFYIHALYGMGDGERAFDELRKSIPSLDEDDLRRRGQIPVFVPNYYRGAYHQHPRTAGRSSQLFNTGAASWLYRIVIEQLFGLCGSRDGLQITPQLPLHWMQARVTREFRGATFVVEYRREAQTQELVVEVDGVRQPDNTIRTITPGQEYHVNVLLPMVSA